MFHLRHDFGDTSRRLLTAELATCLQCGTLRVVEEGKPTRYLQQGKGGSEEAPPCIEPPPRRAYKQGPYALQQALAANRRRDNIDRDPDQG